MLSTVGETVEAEQQHPKVEEVQEEMEDEVMVEEEELVEVEVVEEEEEEDKEVTRIFRMADDPQYSEAVTKTRNHSISVMESADKGETSFHRKKRIKNCKKIRHNFKGRSFSIFWALVMSVMVYAQKLYIGKSVYYLRILSV